MTERVQKDKPQPQEREPEAQHASVPAEREPEAQALVDFSDELLDEIDGLLEENAEEFVKAYVQKGGE